MKKRLLVVEDNFRLLQAINVCLSKSGFEVMTARDGNAALERIAETIPDLIVSDIMMPGMDGFSLAAQVRANPRTDLIPIVFLTAKETRQDRIAGFKVGIDAYLVKPFEPDELVAAIENILSRVSRTHRRVARTSNENNQTAPVTRKSAPVSDLTEAEERVANLVAKSLSNKEIAAQLNISVRTVEMHISNILSKKNWSNRVEIARFVIERDSAK
ncbi:MAG: response regulator transcription factor [Acidobacteria bacterium]|jgi:DNA-binding NarL/FixJ family response regulator|nr:response regulator transcription factor [Acidobacteriota bacterium]